MKIHNLSRYALLVFFALALHFSGFAADDNDANKNDAKSSTAPTLTETPASSPEDTSSSPAPASSSESHPSSASPALESTPLPPTSDVLPTSEPLSIPTLLSTTASPPPSSSASSPLPASSTLSSSSPTTPDSLTNPTTTPKVSPVVNTYGKEKITSVNIDTLLKVSINKCKAESPYYRSLHYAALKGKSAPEQSEIIRILDLSCQNPIITAAFLATFEEMLNHSSNYNSKGRQQLKIDPSERVRISHLFQGVGSSGSAVAASMLFSSDNEYKAVEVLRKLTHRWYTVFKESGNSESASSSASKEPPPTPDDRLRTFLTQLFRSHDFTTGVLKNTSLYIRTFNTLTGSVEILSNSDTYLESNELSFQLGTMAAMARPGFIAAQYLPLDVDDASFVEATPDLSFPIYQTDKTVRKNTVYHIFSIGNEFKGRTPNRDQQAAIGHCCTEINDPNTPLISLSSLNFFTEKLGQFNDVRFSHITEMVKIGIRTALESSIVGEILRELGFNTLPSDKLQAIHNKVEIEGFYDIDEDVSEFDLLSKPEQAWVIEGILDMINDGNFSFLEKLSFKKRFLTENGKIQLINTIAKSHKFEIPTQNTSGNTPGILSKMWSRSTVKKELSISQSILSGREFSSFVKKLTPLTLPQISNGINENIDEILNSFMKLYDEPTAVYKSTGVDDYTALQTRIFWWHMLGDVFNQAAPESLRQFQLLCETRSTTLKGGWFKSGESRMFQLAGELKAILNDHFAD